MISFELFDGLPIEYESFLIKKYESFITTCAYIEINYPTPEIHYMLIYEDEVLIELLVYGNLRKTSTCFNSLSTIDENIISGFTKKIFEKHPSIKKIEIVASYKNYNLNKSFLSYKSENFILDLPASMDEYYSKLSSSTRQTIKNRKVRLLRDYPQVKFVTKFGIDITKTIVDKIIQLNIDKLKTKGVIQHIDETFKTNTFKFSQHYGCVAYMEIDGEIIAGSINSIINRGLFGHVTAFDNTYYKYNVGEICAAYLIQTSIEKGLTRFNFLWGESDLKKRLQGKSHILYSYLSYKTYSVDFFSDKASALFSAFWKSFKQSKLSKPLRIIVKYYISKRFTKQLNNDTKR